MAGSSSFCARPPIRLEFPSFSNSCETAEVLNFIEQCENFLAIRPFPSLKLIGTLSTILKEPAQSWWKAEKAKVTDWQSFKKAFMADYLSEVEEKLRMLVQQPQQCKALQRFLDLAGCSTQMQASKKRNTYLLVIVDYYTKWVKMFPLIDAKTQKIIKILREEIFTRCGVPKHLVSDRGPQFTSSILGDLCKTWGRVQKLTTSYHPQANLTERINWTQKSTGKALAELMLGRQVLGPLESLIHHPPSPNQAAYSLVERQNVMAEEPPPCSTSHTISPTQRLYLASTFETSNFPSNLVSFVCANNSSD
ncbi:hypothetical protein QQF64_028893 [Cirrhinus molitorella]|uniref:Integrase catalytic domain-containing protein n=1 Tax=Cirrhinus molitorella TaxID=172907 RepID=A0ABR3N882_9TELE